MTDEEQRTKRNLICFPIGTIGRDMIYALVANFLLTYTLFTRQLTSAQLGAITAVMVGARVFDALNDPIMGNLIEMTRTRWGKFKPWLLAGAISTTFVIVFLFRNSLTGWSYVIAFGISYFLYSITYTMNDIAYWGMVPALSKDSGLRDAFTSRATLCAGIGNALAGIAIPLFTAGAMALGGNAKSGYGTAAVIICALAIFFQIFTLIGVRENRDDMKETPAKLSLKKIFTTITGNDQLMWISLCFFLQQIGNGIIVGGLGSTYIYFTYGYSGGLYSLFTLVGMAASAVLMVIYPYLSRKFGRLGLLRYLGGLGLFGYGLILLSLVCHGSMTGFWILTIGFMFSSLGQYGYYLIMMIAILNTVEYNEYKYGKRDEAIIASLRPFLTKMGSAAVVLFTSLIYIFFGVTAYTNEISVLENKATAGAITETEKLSAIEALLSTVSNSQKTGLLAVMTLSSAVLLVTSFLIFKRRYRLDEAEYDRILNVLAERKQNERDQKRDTEYTG